MDLVVKPVVSERVFRGLIMVDDKMDAQIECISTAKPRTKHQPRTPTCDKPHGIDHQNDTDLEINRCLVILRIGGKFMVNPMYFIDPCTQSLSFCPQVKGKAMNAVFQKSEGYKSNQEQSWLTK